MKRSFLLVSSVVMLRFLAVFVNTFELDWVRYGALAWLLWLPSLVIYEVVLRSRKATRLQQEKSSVECVLQWMGLQSG